jgi:hypothetical protein
MALRHSEQEGKVMVNRRLLWTACGLALVALALAPRTGATSNEHKRSYLTFSHPVALPGVALGSGTYIFEIATPASGADVVRVMSSDRSISYFMGFTRAVARPHAMPRDQVVSLGESARGVAPPITAWWPEHESTGREFVYEKTR